MELINLKNVSKTFYVKNQEIKAIENVNMTIDEGEIVTIMGRSGSGKSTLINIIAGLLSVDEGEIFFDGNNIHTATQRQLLNHRRNNIGMIVQNYALLENETVYANILLPLKLRRISTKTIHTLIEEMLYTFDLKEKSEIPIYKLSGGQKQRVAIARAMCTEPRVLLADEPTAALDSISEREIMKCFFEINKSGTTIVLVTHDIDIAKQGNRIINIDNGHIV